MGATAILTLALGGLLWRATRPVEQPLLRFSADLGPDAVAGFRITAAISPDGTRIAYPARPPGASVNMLATRLMDQFKPSILPGTEGALDPFFSPDGQWIGFYAVGVLAQTRTDFAIADFWRFWVVHLWVEDFLELFTTIMVAYMFVLLGVVS